MNHVLLFYPLVSVVSKLLIWFPMWFYVFLSLCYLMFIPFVRHGSGSLHPHFCVVGPLNGWREK